jgi:hypothetical protein
MEECSAAQEEMGSLSHADASLKDNVEPMKNQETWNLSVSTPINSIATSKNQYDIKKWYMVHILN